MQAPHFLIIGRPDMSSAIIWTRQPGMTQGFWPCLHQSKVHMHEALEH